MIDLSHVKHHPAVDEIVEVICNRTQNTDRGFFDIEVAYFLAVVAASMRISVVTKDRGEIPINQYAMAFGPSGTGKGYSVNTLENDFFGGFKRRFIDETFPVIAEDNLWKLAFEKAARNSTDENAEKEKLDKDFRSKGALAFTFDSATSPAVKQLRQKLLLANCGCLALQIDEIGSNLIGQTEVLNLFLELYDQGQVKQKLTKNTAENQRDEELFGKTPTNMLLFGTPSKLLDGGVIEQAFYDFLETGYARRCLFGIGQRVRASRTLTAEEIYARLTDPNNNAVVDKWYSHFYNLADPNKFGQKINVDDHVAVELLRYKIECEDMADALPEHEDIRKSELSHRYFKALKLAGAYAFVDESTEVDLDHLYSAIKLVEQSGECFVQILRRDKVYVKLAKYLGAVGSEVTHADLVEALPFYPASGARRSELMALGRSWGIKNNIIIRSQYLEGIEFFRGETLEQTSLDHLSCSYSMDMAYGYYPESTMPFNRLYELCAMPGYHWANHHYKGGHRNEENALPGFNMVVLDVDGGTNIDLAHDLMKDWTFMTHTTKRHSEEDHRFRLILPVSHKLYMEADEYKEFMMNIVNWLPFKVDEGANQRSRKWLTNEHGKHHYNPGELLDILQFIPKSSKNEQYKERFEKVANLDNLERWFAERMTSGSRNNHFLRYAMALLDTGCQYNEVESRVLDLNSKISNPLPEDEIRSTILVTVAKKMSGQP